MYKEYLTTFSGKQLNLQFPKKSDILLIDIAHGLSLENRWASQTPFHYSVATHSLLVAALFHTPKEKLLALLHDSTEAYIKDLPSPLKRLLPEYKKIEENLQNVIYEKFLLKPTKQEITNLKKIDLEIMDYEYDNIFIKRNIKLKYAPHTQFKKYRELLKETATKYYESIK